MPLPVVYAFPVHPPEEEWTECDGCTDELPKDSLIAFLDWLLCPECHAYYASLKFAKSES